jgi:hypothetical protein
MQPTSPETETRPPSPLWPGEYAGQWIAWDHEETRVIASGQTFSEVVRAAAAAGERAPVVAKVPPAELLPFRVHPLVVGAQQAFERALPQLLRERPGQWVAYHGDRLIGFAPSKSELYQECLRQGLPRGEFLVRSIEPGPEVIAVGPGVID